MKDLSAELLSILDELTAQLATGEALSALQEQRLSRAWNSERPGDERGLRMLLETLRARPQAQPTRGGTQSTTFSFIDDDDSTPSEVAQAESAPEEVDGWRYPVFFATNRECVETRDRTPVFGAHRSPITTRGRCDVWLPRSRRFGELGTPWWRRWMSLRFRDDHVRLEHAMALEASEFVRQVREQMDAASGEKHALVFIHGYRTSFEDAALRAAQLGFDLQVSGATAFFAWPSQGTLGGYPADGAAIEASEGAISRFLVEFANESGADAVHIVAHSMGNRGLLRALQRMAADASAAAGVKFGQVILAAPDVDRDLFVDLASVYAKFARRTTLYASRADRAVQASSWLHGAARAGYLPPVTVVAKELRLDTIAVPDLDLDALGHSAFAGDALLQDMFELIRHGTPPERRQRLIAQGAYWAFQH